MRNIYIYIYLFFIQITTFIYSFILLSGMKRKGQITLFLIFGLIILFSFWLLSGIKSEPKSQTQLDTNPIKLYTENCIISVLEKGINKVGFAYSSQLEDYIDSNLDRCINNFDVFQGTIIDAGSISSKIMLSENKKNLMVSVDYPLTIKKYKIASTLDKFYINYNLETETNLNLLNGITVSKSKLFSANKLADIEIQSNTQITGTSSDNIYLTIRDVRLSGVSLSNVIGFLSYNLEPNLSSFDSVNLNINYDDSMLLSNFDENKLVISYWKDGFWYILPTIIDSEKNIASADLKFFGEHALTDWNVYQPQSKDTIVLNEPIDFTKSWVIELEGTMGPNWDKTVFEVPRVMHAGKINEENYDISIIKKYPGTVFRFANRKIYFDDSKVGGIHNRCDPDMDACKSDHWGTVATGSLNGDHKIRIEYSADQMIGRFYWDGSLVGDWTLFKTSTPSVVTELSFPNFHGTIRYYSE